MSFFLVKSILGLMLLLAGFIAFLSMLTLMGKKEKKLINLEDDLFLKEAFNVTAEYIESLK